MSQTFLLPEFEVEHRKKPVNVASVPQLSPFRYPGGKTWLVPLFRQWMKSFARRPQHLIEPFAGGGIIGLTAAFEQLSSRVVMSEIDERVASVWKVILGGDAEWLAKRILKYELSAESVMNELKRPAASLREQAFQTILRNRTAHGGILADGAGVLKSGENGKGIGSRWYPQTIARRILSIGQKAHQIEFRQEDAFQVIAAFQTLKDTAFFIDPPYTAGGKSAGSRLYTHCLIDHERLFSLCSELKGDFLMTYDNAEEVRLLALKYGFEIRPVSMKNTHHAEMSELLIGRDLSWLANKEIC